MGVKKSGYVRDEQGNRVVGQQMRPGWLEDVTRPARAWSDTRYRDYERQAQRDLAEMRTATPFDYRRYPPRWRAWGDAEIAAIPVPEDDDTLRHRSDLERAAATPVPDDDDLADNAMNLRRRVMGQ